MKDSGLRLINASCYAEIVISHTTKTNIHTVMLNVIGEAVDVSNAEMRIECIVNSTSYDVRST
jgi:hypothetical protein